MQQITTLQYNDQFAVDFTNDVWFNATAVAKNFGKLPNEWLRLESTQEYIQKLTNFLLRENPAIKNDEFALSKTQRGRHNSGTWFHPKLAVAFARWLDVEFSIWCDMQIEKLLHPKRNALVDLPPATPKTLTPAMLRHITKRVNWLVNNQIGTSFGALGGAILDNFNVNKRENIPLEKYAEVCAFLDCEPDAKALEGMLLEPAKVEYQPPEGMILVSVEDFEKLKNKPAEMLTYQGWIEVVNQMNEASFAVVSKSPLLELRKMIDKILPR